MINKKSKDKSKDKKNIKGIHDGKYIAIDFGTASTKVYIKGKGIVFNEASLIAYDSKTKKIISVGNNTKKILGKINDHQITIKYPLKNGAITDIKIAEDFIVNLFKTKKYEEFFKNAFVLLICPVGVTSMEKNALKKICDNLGAKYSEIQDDVKLSLIGVGYDIYDSTGRLILDIGSGKATAATVSAGNVLMAKTIRNAGKFMDDEIKKFIKSYHTINIGELTAEELKNKLASLSDEKEDQKEMLIYGRDVTSLLPKEVYISSKSINEILFTSFGPIIDLLTEVLGNSPSEFVRDVVSNGIILVGGITQLKGIKQFFEKCFKVKIKIEKNASIAAINGAINYEKNLINNYKGIYNELSLGNN